MSSDSTIRVRLTVEYDMEIFDDDPTDIYILSDQELQFLENNGVFEHFPDTARYSLVPTLEAGT